MIESELKSFQMKEVDKAQTKSRKEEGEEEEGDNIAMEEVSPDPDADEGFFDKPSVSPVSILSTSSVLSSSSISSLEPEVEVKLGVGLQLVV